MKERHKSIGNIIQETKIMKEQVSLFKTTATIESFVEMQRYCLTLIKNK